jgi:hypothetical protein
MSRKFAVGTASVLAYVGATLAFVICLKSILLAIVTLISIPSWLIYAIGLFIPSNAIGVISQILAANICRQAYLITVAKIQMMNHASGV